MVYLDIAAETTKSYKEARSIKQRPVDIVVGTKSRFESRKGIPSVENEVYRKGYYFMTQKTKEWCDLEVMDLDVAKHLENSYKNYFGYM